jgi:hypothetical protein
MEKLVEVRNKNVYGVDLTYPINETAKQLAALTGKKTFSRIDISRIESLGFEVVNQSFIGSQF